MPITSANVQLLSLPGMLVAFEKIISDFHAKTGHKINSTYDPEGAVLRRVRTGEFYDALIVSERIKEFSDGSFILPSTLLELARVGVGVWIREGEVRPDISTEDAFKAALLNAKTISWVRESGTGAYLISLVHRLSIEHLVLPKTLLLDDPNMNQMLVAAGEVELAITVLSAKRVPGVALLGPLPEKIQNWAVFYGATTPTSRFKPVVRDFFDYVRSTDAAPALEDSGMQQATR